MKIKKAKKIVGKSLVFKNVEVSDSIFILNLRTNKKKTLYLSKVEQDLDKQINWIRNYNLKENEAYFVILYEDKKIGTVRIYDANLDSFCWGSWILAEQSPLHAALESALIVYSYAFNNLGFNRSHFDVRKENIKVCKFHERFGAELIRTDEINNYYTIQKHQVLVSLEKYKKYLNTNLVIEY